MSFAQRFSLVLLAAFFITTFVTSAAGYLFAAPVLRAASRRDSSSRAPILAAYRLLPSIAALVLTGVVLAPGYFRHEQRGELEGAGIVLAMLAAGGLCILLASVARLCRAALSAARLRRVWIAEGRAIEMAGAGLPVYAIASDFPLVAVLGAFRPRLFVSTSVLSACSASELSAIVEHERRHVSAFDNVVRLAMDAAPDALRLTRVPEALAGSWHQAAEHRADDAAGRRLDLASALVRVSRLAGAPPPVNLPASALYRGEGIEERVKRLLGPAAPGSIAQPVRRAAAAAAVAIVALVATGSTARVSEIAHDILEAIVSLP
jgi:hypothetical protein